MTIIPIDSYAEPKELIRRTPHGGIQESDSKNRCDSFSLEEEKKNQKRVPPRGQSKEQMKRSQSCD